MEAEHQNPNPNILPASQGLLVNREIQVANGAKAHAGFYPSPTKGGFGEAFPLLFPVLVIPGVRGGCEHLLIEG